MEKGERRVLMSCILKNHPPWRSPVLWIHFELMSYPWKIIVLSLSLTLLPFWTSTSAPKRARGLIYCCNYNIRLTCGTLIRFMLATWALKRGLVISAITESRNRAIKMQSTAKQECRSGCHQLTGSLPQRYGAEQLPNDFLASGHMLFCKIMPA